MSNTEQEILDTLKDIHKWIRFSGWPNVKKILLDTLKEPEEKVAYSLTDGVNGLDLIRGRIGTSRSVVQRYWKIWQRIGIVESIKVSGGSRAKALFDLEAFGIEIPELEFEEHQNSIEEEGDDE